MEEPHSKPNLTQVDPEAYNQAIRELTHLNLRLRSLDKAKDEFISIASHELRNPMAIIKGTISMILAGDEGEVSEEVRKDLTDIMVVVERQIRLVNELLDVSRIEAGVMFFNLKPGLNLVHLAKLLESSLNSVARQSGVKVEVIDNPTLPTVQADQDKISQVLVNLVTNALKFTQQGSIKISFEQKGDIVVVSVHDTGIGIPEDKKDQLFKKFTKPASATVGVISAGSGLGLYISKKFVEHHGGKLWLEKSELGRGSTFCFSLPVSDSLLAKKVFSEVESVQKIKKVHYKNEGGAQNE